MDDPNIIYGGDVELSHFSQYASLGDMIVDSLRKNGHKENLVSLKFK